MLPKGEDAGRGEDEMIHVDEYLDSLLTRTARPAALAQPPADDSLRRAIDALAGLPRLSPSFAFEEALAARLRELADAPAGEMAEVIVLPVGTRAATQRVPTFAGIDRRLIVGGAIASGVSLAGIAGLAAALAWRHRAPGRTA